MNFFRKLFFKPTQQPVVYNFETFAKPAVTTKPHPENAPGGFYVINGECILCGAPEVEGHGLIEHSIKDGYGSCFFKKQPETDEEIEHAINAVRVSCIDAIRYGGNDENILRKMYELGLQGQCDYVPKGGYRLTMRNITCFYSTENISTVAKTLVDGFVKQSYHKVIDFYCDKTSQFSFAVRLADLYAGNFVKGEVLQKGFYKITITRETGAITAHVVHTAEDVHKVLVEALHVSNIQWYEKEISGDGAPRPTFV